MLIAEIGNVHFGSLTKAKELIKAAHEAGADLIKSQAFRAEDLNIDSLSMPAEFYKKCEFTVEQYLHLIEYARSIGNDLFFSIFSQGMEMLSLSQTWHKVAGSQTGGTGIVKEWMDTENMILSVPKWVIDSGYNHVVYRFKHASVLYVGPYLTDPHIELYLPRLALLLKRPVGYSDHSEGVEKCMLAAERFGVNVIEKHFCLKKNEAFLGTVYRDTIHSATPKEFNDLSAFLSADFPTNKEVRT